MLAYFGKQQEPMMVSFGQLLKTDFILSIQKTDTGCSIITGKDGIVPESDFTFRCGLSKQLPKSDTLSKARLTLMNDTSNFNSVVSFHYGYDWSIVA